MKHENIIKLMSLEEKASLTSGKDFWQTMDVNNQETGVVIPSIFLSDGPHGIRKQAAAADHLGLNASIPSTCFPPAGTMANSWDVKLGEELGKALGKEAAHLKVNILLGPGMNIKRNPKCGRNFEYFSEDPYLSGKIAASYVRGIQSQGVSACIKHFAANNQETRRMVYDSVVDERALREVYLTGFEIAVKEAKPMSIMTSYNKLNGTYTNENQHLLNEILRQEWGYDGFIVTDWGGNNIRVDGLKAGNALEMPTTQGETNEEVIQAVKDGILDEAVLDKRVDELLDVIFTTQPALEKDNPFDVEEHHLLAQRCAEESLVLLKNEDNVLPLRKEDKVAFIGDFFNNPRYQGAGSSVVNPTKLDNILAFKDEYDFNYVGYAQGYHRYGKKKNGLFKKALKLAKNADVIVYAMGLDEVTEAEGLDRETTLISERQIDLLKALKALGKKVVVVLSCGSVVDLSWDVNADALIHAYLAGQAGAKAVLNVLEGKVNPSGKLSETYPNKYEDIPAATVFPEVGMSVVYKESIYVGYRYFASHPELIKYPFGYGLSYTTFEYSNLTITETGVKFTIKNTGAVAGKEIAQLYVAKENSAIFRPKHELKGFAKVELQPGEEKEVEIAFDDKTFRYFNIATNKFEIEAGEYKILVGASSEDIRLNGSITREGTTDVLPYNEEINANYKAENVLTNVSDETFVQLLGRELPPSELNFINKKKTRIIVDYNTTVLDLRYSKGWSGRFFSWAIRVACGLLRFFGNKTMANTIVMGVYHNPMRGLSRMSGGMISWKQLDGLITMFNGKFFKGLGMFFKAGKERKKAKKAAEKAKKAEK